MTYKERIEALKKIYDDVDIALKNYKVKILKEEENNGTND